MVAARSAARQDFFPLTVDYVEKFYAAGRIPGGYFKREGRPTEREILICRLIDRPIRPLFPEGLYNEVQVIVQVMSSNPEVDSDIPAMLGASAALALSGIPFDGPIGAARVGYIDGQYVLNPSATQMDGSARPGRAGTDAAVLMVESEAHELPEDVCSPWSTATSRCRPRSRRSTSWSRWRQARGTDSTPKNEGTPASTSWPRPTCGGPRAATSSSAGAHRRDREGDDREDRRGCGHARPSAARVNDLGNMLFDLQYPSAARSWRARRASMAATRTVWPIAIRTSVMPRAHGSALFTRGETQAIVVANAARRADHRRDHRRVPRALHVQLQHAAVRHR